MLEFSCVLFCETLVHYWLQNFHCIGHNGMSSPHVSKNVSLTGIEAMTLGLQCSSWQVLVKGSLTPFLFVQQLTFVLKSVEYDYIRIFKVSDFQAMGISIVGKAWDCKHHKWALQS